MGHGSGSGVGGMVPRPHRLPRYLLRMTSAALPGSAALARGVLADRVALGSRARFLLPVIGAAVVGLFAQVSVPLPFTPVPLTGQTLGVLLVGAALGPRRGAASLGLYVLGGAVGLPLYAAGASGVGALVGPTGGYLVGFVVAAWLVGALAARGHDRGPATMLAVYALGTAAIYVLGASWLAVVLGVGPWEAFVLGVAPFLVGDAVKALLAAGLLPAAWRLLGTRD